MSQLDLRDYEYTPELEAIRSRIDSERYRRTSQTFDAVSSHDLIASSYGLQGTARSVAMPQLTGMNSYVTNSAASRNANRRASLIQPSQAQQFASNQFTSTRRASPPSLPSSASASAAFSSEAARGGPAPYLSSSERELYLPRGTQTTGTTSEPYRFAAQQPVNPPSSPIVIWTDVEPWMDEYYARQVCSLMGWDAAVSAPHISSDATVRVPYCSPYRSTR